jgi:hypothetical protein
MLKGEHEKKGSLSRLPLSIFCCKQLLAQAKSMKKGEVSQDFPFQSSAASNYLRKPRA